MRKSILAGLVALGLVVTGMTAMASAMTRQADAECSGVDVRVTHHVVLAAADNDRSRAPTCVDVGSC